MAKKRKVENDIARLAKRAADDLLDEMPLLKSASPTERSIAISRALDVEQSSAAKLKAAFVGDTSFGKLRGGWVQTGDGGFLQQAHMLPFRLISCALSGEAIGPIVAQARIIAKSSACVIEWYFPLAGVSVTESVKLEENVHLIPWANVPDSNAKEVFNPDREVRFESGFPMMRAKANSAIRVCSPKRRVLFSSHEDAKSATKDQKREERTEIISDAVRCITALSMHSVSMIGEWSQFERKVDNFLGLGGYSHGATMFEQALWFASRTPVPLDGKAVARLLRNFKKMSSSEQKVIRIALDRLNQALRRQNLVDKAIDLGIALEVILLHGINAGDRGELRYRSSVRGATFLGKNKEERATIFKRLRDSYDLRSVAVHSGVVESKKGKKSPEKILEEALRDSANIVRKLIDQGSFPDWDVEYVVRGK